MAFAYFSFIAICVQVVTCQGVGNMNTGFNNGLPFSNIANGVNPGLVNSGFIGPGLGGPSLGNPDLVNSGLVGSGFISNGLGIPGLGNHGLGGPGFVGGAGLGSPSLTGACRSGSGGFAVTSSSPISPTGVSILAENLSIEGPLSVGGQIPFLGTVGIEGTLPATGSGTVSYGCGSGNIGITSDVAEQYGSAIANQYGPGLSGYGVIAGQGIAANLAAYKPGSVGAGLNGPGLAGPGLFGNGLPRGLGGNYAGSGIAV